MIRFILYWDSVKFNIDHKGKMYQVIADMLIITCSPLAGWFYNL